MMPVSTMLVSSREDFPRRPGIVIHDPEAIRVQSTARPRGYWGRDKSRGREENQQLSFDKAESISSVPQNCGRVGQKTRSPTKRSPDVMDEQKEKCSNKHFGAF